MNREKLDEIVALVSRLLADSGFECIEAEWVGSDRILRLFIDLLPGSKPETSGETNADEPTPETGISLDQCVRASRLLNERPEIDELVKGAFTLEVSSPGIERPLRTRPHFEQVVGKEVRVKLAEKVQDRRNGTGRLVEVVPTEDSKDTSITLATAEGGWTFRLSSLQRACLVYDWGEG